MIETQKSRIVVSGRARLTAFEPGVISGLMAGGKSFWEAYHSAVRRGAARKVVTAHNLDANVGLQFVARRITGEESSGLGYLAIGTGTTAPLSTDTELETETARRALVECKQSDLYFYSTVFFLASECSVHVTEGGVFGGVSASLTANSGLLLARFLLDFDNTVTQYDLTIQHTGELEAG